MLSAWILGSVLAAGAPGVVVLPPTAEGDISIESRDALAQTLRAGLERGGTRVLETPEATPCPDRSCAAARAKAAGADYAVVPRFGAEGRDYAVSVTLVPAEAPETTMNIEQSCELCGLAEVSNVVADVATSLVTRITQLAQPARIAATTTPEGALVSAAGTDLGVTPFDLELPPGRYALRFSRDGYIEQHRDVVAVSGATAHVAVTLQPAPVADTRKRLGLHVAGGILDGVGLAALGAGAALLTLHGRPYAPSCGEPRDPVTGRCRQRYDTLAGGLAAVGGAVVSLGLGITLHVIASRRAKRRRRSQSGTGP